MEVSVGVSNRHVHLTEEDFKILFGEEATLEVYKPINQPGQFSSTSFVTLKTKKDTIEKVRVLGPFRTYTQIEISKTDAYKLGLNPPVRTSGDIKGSEAITLIGPKGTLEKKEGCIIADRHIHILPSQAEMYGLNNVEEVSVMIPGEKGGILSHVKIRISEQSYYEMHLDTDDANAHFIKNGDIVKIVKI
jgi:putative phosphotransacetylase